jgi:hypothetical protein
MWDSRWHLILGKRSHFQECDLFPIEISIFYIIFCYIKSLIKQYSANKIKAQVEQKTIEIKGVESFSLKTFDITNHLYRRNK